MKIADFLEARYGDWVFGDVRYEEAEEMKSRQLRLWRVLAARTGSSAQEPEIHCIHSPRGLPAFMGATTTGSQLVWDAGLGTIFDHLAFPLSNSQPPTVVEALLRQVIAIRLLISGELGQASAQIRRVKALLEQTPIDRSYQQNVDAEDQFEVYLLTEVQEEFVLAHELAHHLRAVDAAAMSRFENVVLHSAFASSPPDRGVLSTDGLDQDLLFEAGINPYAWYLESLPPDDELADSWSAYLEDLAFAREHFRSLSASAREEILCDLLAAATVSIAADGRESGWSAAMSVAVARVALVNMRLLSSIDGWISGRSSHPAEVLRRPNERERCLMGLLPRVLNSMLEQQSVQAVPAVGDIYAVMAHADRRVAEQLSPAVRALTLLKAESARQAMDADAILVFAGFIPIRPPADNRVVNRIANHFKFEVGALRRSHKIQMREFGDIEFVKLVDDLVLRHQRGDWGEIYDEDAEANERALFEEFMPPTPQRIRGRGIIWSFYKVEGQTVIVKTSRDRSVTEVVFISEM